MLKIRKRRKRVINIITEAGCGPKIDSTVILTNWPPSRNGTGSTLKSPMFMLRIARERR
jgi:hypothetical protein